LKDRTLSIELSYPLEMIKALAPEVKAVHDRLEPVLVNNSCLKIENLELKYAENESWLAIVKVIRTKIDGVVSVFIPRLALHQA